MVKEGGPIRTHGEGEWIFRIPPRIMFSPPPPGLLARDVDEVITGRTGKAVERSGRERRDKRHVMDNSGLRDVIHGMESQYDVADAPEVFWSMP